MRIARGIGIGLVIMAVLCQLVTMGAAAADDEMVVQEMVLTGETSVPLENATVTVTQPTGERIEIPVGMSKSTYRATVRTVINGVTKDWSGELSFYEISSTEPAVPFVWVLCNSWPVDRVFVLTDEKSRDSYFALTIGGHVVFFIRTTEPRDQTEAMADFCLMRDWNGGFHVPVIDVIGVVPFLTRDATHIGGDVVVTSIAHSQAGWTVKVRGPLSDEVFTLVSPDGKVWRRGG